MRILPEKFRIVRGGPNDVRGRTTLTTGNDCKPLGIPQTYITPYPFQIMQDERQIALLFEINTWHHVIPFASEFPKQAADNPTWYGYSTNAGAAGRCSAFTLKSDRRDANGSSANSAFTSRAASARNAPACDIA